MTPVKPPDSQSVRDAGGVSSRRGVRRHGSTPGLAIAPNFVWSPGYYARVSGLADQLVIMAYDTAIPTPPSTAAIYAGWTTDAGDWAVYERVWRGREGG